jgi:uncharacterized membrane protein YbhN (UPF0104 family)
VKKGLLLLKIAFSITLIFVLSRKFSLAEAGTHLLHLRMGPAIGALLLLGLSLALSGLRWHYASGQLITLPVCLRFTWISQLYALVLPGALSADVAKGLVMTAKKESSCGCSLSTSIILDRVAGLGSLLVFGFLSCLSRPELLHLPPGVLVTLSALGTLALIALPWVLNHFLPRLTISPRTWFLVLGLSGLIHAVNISFYCVSLAAVGGSESWWQMGIYTCLLNLAMLLPISIGGIGLREQIAVSLFQSSANAPVQIAFGWLVLFLSILHGLIGLALHWQRTEPSNELVSAGDIG